MRKLFFLLLLAPLFSNSQAPIQTKTILSSSRYFCKPDKTREFEKALAAHAKKFHKGDWTWRVWTIETGPDAGGYMVTEGPSDWASIDGRKDISSAHMDDWNTTVAPLTTSQYSNSFYEYKADMSTVQLTDFADKIIISHLIAKPGKIAAANELIKKLKKVWEAGGESVAVYSPIASGEPSVLYVDRLKNGLKELTDGYRKPVADRFKEAYGQSSWDAWLKDYSETIERRWSELLFYKPELSSE